MLIIANGAFKSGSTWQFNIIKQLTAFEAVPEVYRQAWTNPSINPKHLTTFLEQVDLSKQNYISKNHFSDRATHDLLLANPNVRIFNIKRDLRDVLVSAYYHHSRSEATTLNFTEFYFEHGQDIAKNVMRYHKLWESSQSPHYFLSSYEGLHENFRGEVMKMAVFLGLSLNEVAIRNIDEACRIEKLREEYGETTVSEENRFFRKGVVGDWQNYFDASTSENLAKLQADFAKERHIFTRLQQRLRFLKRWQ